MRTRTQAAIAAGLVLFIWLAVAARTQAAQQWPVVKTSNGYTLTVFQPQAKSWENHTKLTGMQAASVQGPDKKTYFGVINLSADTVADVDAGTVVVSNIQVTSTSFPTLTADQQQRLDSYIRSQMSEMGTRVVPLNTVLLSLKSSSNAATRNVKINTTPPKIYYSQKPAILVSFDGPTIFSPIKGMTAQGLSFGANTNWQIFKTGNTYYLLNNTYWLQASSINGPWKPVSKLPTIFSQLPNEDNWKSVRAQLNAPAIAASKVPIVWVATTPAEAIVTNGAPNAVAIAGTSLSYIDNTDAALFYDRANKKYYYLTSGRWFATSDPSGGSWTFANQNLPADFAKIPPDSQRGWVLASVPGTPQAAAAVGAADVPREASVNRASATIDVKYSGDPIFKPIPGTSLEYAVNTPFDVLHVGDAYYACNDGVWFTASSPNGPWTVADSVPQTVYTIPSDQPLYNDTYVTVETSDANTVTDAYTGGYLYSYPWYGGLYYGTGYWGAPWYGFYGGYPVYYPMWPRTYVGGTYYNPATGAYARGYGVYGPYGGARATAGYNPSTGNYWRGGSVYGPYGGMGHGTIYNPATGNYYHGAVAWGPNGIAYRGSSGNVGNSVTPYGSRYGTNVATNPYKNWGNAATLKSSPTTFRPSATDNVYAGRDGNVYRNTSTGGWQQYNNGTGGWKNTDISSANGARGYTNTGGQSGWNNAATRGSEYTSTANQLGRDSFARSAGYGGMGFSGGFRGGGFRGR